MKTKFKARKKYLHFWDSIARFPICKKYISSFDSVSSFDRTDCDDYVFNYVCNLSTVPQNYSRERSLKVRFSHNKLYIY